MTGSHFRGGWLVFCRREKKQVTIYRSRAITRRLVGVIAVYIQNTRGIFLCSTLT